MPKKKSEAKKQEEKAPGIKKIRMLRSLGTARGAYLIGKSYQVGSEVPLEYAESWLRAGAAEEDKDLERPPEIKENL
jgi:hypothetical protein